MGLLRAIHRLHAARAGLPTPSQPWACDATFLQGAARREGLGRYERFVREGGDGHVLLLELGVGEMTPGIIMLPFWSMAAKLPDAHLLNINISDGSAPLQLGSKAEAIRADLGRLVATREFAIWGRWRNLKMSPSFSGSRPLEAADLIRVVFPGKITRTEPLYGRAYLTEQRTTSHGDTRPSLCFTRFYCSLFAIAWSISLSSAARCSAELMAPTIGSPTMLPF